MKIQNDCPTWKGLVSNMATLNTMKHIKRYTIKVQNKMRDICGCACHPLRHFSHLGTREFVETINSCEFSAYDLLNILQSQQPVACEALCILGTIRGGPSSEGSTTLHYKECFIGSRILMAAHSTSALCPHCSGSDLFMAGCMLVLPVRDAGEGLWH